ncbi:uncharacterized protein [Ptychodera flava]|uniref:uncharacterized protein n=1 Tax=Ptychodera flava TaxID=63121 RepID=UPI00396A6A43
MPLSMKQLQFSESKADRRGRVFIAACQSTTNTIAVPLLKLLPHQIFEELICILEHCACAHSYCISDPVNAEAWISLRLRIPHRVPSALVEGYGLSSSGQNRQQKNQGRSVNVLASNDGGSSQPSAASSGSIPLRIVSTVRGYHAFRIRPHVSVWLEVKDEEGNRYDPYAMGVWFPKLEKIPEHLHHEITRKGDQRGPEQTVHSNSGKQVGRVPANLCKAFRQLKEQGKITDIKSEYTGEVGLSSNPHHHQKFKKSVTGRDRPGEELCLTVFTMCT